MAILRKPPWWDAFVSWRFWKMCPIPTLQTTGSLLCGDGRHLGFVHATDRSKFNCSWAVPRSARGCWIHGRHRGMSLELLLIPLISAQEYLVRVPWLRAPFETALTPKTLQKFCCTKYPHRTKTAAQNWMVCSFLPLSQEQEGGKKSPLHHFLSPYQELPALQSLIILEDVAWWWCKIWPFTPLWLLHGLRDTP